MCKSGKKRRDVLINAGLIYSFCICLHTQERLGTNLMPWSLTANILVVSITGKSHVSFIISVSPQILQSTLWILQPSTVGNLAVWMIIPIQISNLHEEEHIFFHLTCVFVYLTQTFWSPKIIPVHDVLWDPSPLAQYLDKIFLRKNTFIVTILKFRVHDCNLTLWKY